MKRHQVNLSAKNQVYGIGELVDWISLSESIDEIAYKAEMKLVVTRELAEVGIGPGQSTEIIAPDFESSRPVSLFQGVIWDVMSVNAGQKHIAVTAFDRNKYLDESEDEYLFPAGQTATQRIKTYAKDWQIPLGNLPETGVALAKAVYRAQSIYSMIRSDIQESAEKGGKLYKPRMVAGKLSLVEIGGNDTVWTLNKGRNIEEVGQRRTLDGAVTQVKVLGTATDDAASPVLDIRKKDTEKFGTLQRIVQNEKITNSAEAKRYAERLLTGVQECITVQAIDINTIRAGDKVFLENWALIVDSVQRKLGSPGHMMLRLVSYDYIRRSYYDRRSV